MTAKEGRHASAPLGTATLGNNDQHRDWPELDANERGWLQAQLGTHPLRPEALDHQERARVAAVVALVMRRRAGWAA